MKGQRASSPSFYSLFRSNRHPVVWLAHQPLVIPNEGLTHTILENSLPPYWTACFKLKQGNMCQQVSPNDSSSRSWDRICKYNNNNIYCQIRSDHIKISQVKLHLNVYINRLPFPHTRGNLWSFMNYIIVKYEGRKTDVTKQKNILGKKYSWNANQLNNLELLSC